MSDQAKKIVRLQEENQLCRHQLMEARALLAEYERSDRMLRTTAAEAKQDLKTAVRNRDKWRKVALWSMPVPAVLLSLAMFWLAHGLHAWAASR